jgi:4-hydroxy-tetrahydrodipicolinate reductase
MIKVGVLGAKGRMGSQVCSTVESADDLTLSAQVDLGDSLDQLTGTDVVVDFTHPGAVMGNLHWCVEHGIASVVGTSGFDDARLDELAGWLAGQSAARVLVVPNFSVGAVLMMRFAELAAPFFESAEVIELHHAGKADAPSGTAARTASMISAARSARRTRRPSGSAARRPRRDPDNPA